MEVNIPNATQRYKVMKILFKWLNKYGEYSKNVYHLLGNLEGANRRNNEKAIFKKVIAKDFLNIRNSKNFQTE